MSRCGGARAALILLSWGRLVKSQGDRATWEPRPGCLSLIAGVGEDGLSSCRVRWASIGSGSSISNKSVRAHEEEDPVLHGDVSSGVGAPGREAQGILQHRSFFFMSPHPLVGNI